MTKMTKTKKARRAVAAPQLVEAAARGVERNLDLGCGLNVRDGYEGVDLYGDKAKHRVDLFKFPWPFEDSSVDNIHASHFLEHIPAREVEERDLADRVLPGQTATRVHMNGTGYLGADMLFAFMDECWRILKPDGWISIIVPSGRSNRAFQDPTHRRFFMQETFFYFWQEWRVINGLDHYRLSCSFGAESVVASIQQDDTLRAPEVQQRRFNTEWNATIDWHAKMKKINMMTTGQIADVRAKIQQAQAAQQQQQPAPPPEPRRSCMTCGAQNEADATFCKKCGASVAK